jgi:hypothetical protein
MKTIVAFVFIAILTSCSKSNDDEPQPQALVDINIELSIKNSSGEDLLDPNNPNAYKAKNIKLYYLINGEKKEIFDENLTYPRNFFIFKHESEYRIRVFQNHSETERLPITYIEWSPDDTDTLQTEIFRDENSIRATKTWFNGELKWDVENEQEPYFSIIK